MSNVNVNPTANANANANPPSGGKSAPPSSSSSISIAKGRLPRPSPYPIHGRPRPSLPQPPPPPPPPGDRSITTLIIENIGDHITKKDVILAFQELYQMVTSISLRPTERCIYIQFKTRGAAEKAFQAKLGYATIAGSKYSLGWDLYQNQDLARFLPPPPPNIFPEVESFTGTQARGYGRGSHDPQFRQLGHFMDTSQLVSGPGGGSGKKGTTTTTGGASSGNRRGGRNKK